MKKYGLYLFILIAVVLIKPVCVFAQDEPIFDVKIKTPATVITYHDQWQFTLDVDITNVGVKEANFFISDCESFRHWKTDNVYITIKPPVCLEGYIDSHYLIPGTKISEQFTMIVSDEAKTGDYEFSIAFTPALSRNPVIFGDLVHWSNPIKISVDKSAFRSWHVLVMLIFLGCAMIFTYLQMFKDKRH